jgi:hypothetical protein
VVYHYDVDTGLLGFNGHVHVFGGGETFGRTFLFSDESKFNLKFSDGRVRIYRRRRERFAGEGDVNGDQTDATDYELFGNKFCCYVYQGFEGTCRWDVSSRNDTNRDSKPF